MRKGAETRVPLRCAESKLPEQGVGSGTLRPHTTYPSMPRQIAAKRAQTSGRSVCVETPDGSLRCITQAGICGNRMRKRSSPEGTYAWIAEERLAFGYVDSYSSRGMAPTRAAGNSRWREINPRHEPIYLPDVVIAVEPMRALRALP